NAGTLIRISSVGIISSSLSKVFHTMKFMIKIGLVLLQKESRYTPSSREILPERTRSPDTFAPIGYPHRKPAITAKEPFGDVANKVENSLPNILDMTASPPPESISPDTSIK